MLATFDPQLTTCSAAPLGTGFTYQGRLTQNGAPATGMYDLRFVIWDLGTAGTAVAGPVTNSPVGVVNGLFTVALDVGPGVFTGEARWLEIAVRTNGSLAEFTVLAPRQPLTPAPHALYAPNAGSALAVTGPVAASQLTGTLAASNLGPGTITGAMLAAGSITSEALADGAVTADKLHTTGFSTVTGAIPNPAPATDDNFGYALAAVGSDKLLVGAYRDDGRHGHVLQTDQGRAFLFHAGGAILATVQHPAPSSNDDQFGAAAAAVGSDRVLIGAPNNNTGANSAGAAFLLDLNGALLTAFTNPAPTAEAHFGQALAAVGTDRVLIGPCKAGQRIDREAACLFDLNGGLLATFASPTAGTKDAFGWALATVGSDRVLIGARNNDTGAANAGAVYVFDLNGTLLQSIPNPAPSASAQFGSAVAGFGSDRLLIGAPRGGMQGEGVAYLMRIDGTRLATFSNPAPAGQDFFGGAVAMLGTDKVIIGAYGSDLGATNAGSVYVFNTNGTWLATLANPEPAANEYFGRAVAALDAETVVVGADGENTGAAGAGSVYVFQLGRYLTGVAGDGAAPGSIRGDMLASGAVGNPQLAVGAVSAGNLASGAALANLYASGQSAVPSGGIVMSEQANNTNLLNAGYVKIGKLDLIEEGWTTNAAGPPSVGLPNMARSLHSAVWTGTEMIVWGGLLLGTPVNDGLRYNPATDVWAPISSAGAPRAAAGHLGAWTGSRMLIWVGDQGGLYNPTTDTWTELSRVNAPNGGRGFLCGNTLVVLAYADDYLGMYSYWYSPWDMLFGGSFPPFRGKRYNLATGTWSSMSSNQVCAPRGDFSAVWTGTELLIWGGYNHSAFLDTHSFRSVQDGARYNPVTDVWTAISTNNVPSPRRRAYAVWTGSEMLVWGGEEIEGSNSDFNWEPVPTPLFNGGRYNPAANSWSAMNVSGGPGARKGGTAVWGGGRMVIWGGQDYDDNPLNNGSRYNPSTDSWAATLTGSAPPARWDHSAVWTGSRMIVWGGTDGPNLRNEGGRYDVANNTWTATAPTPATGEPGARQKASAIWTGAEMIVWGGEYNGLYLRGGGRYDPAANVWQNLPLSNAPTARIEHTEVWTGAEMIVWGGFDGDLSQTGARYNPMLNSWRNLSMANAPLARLGHSAVWTGNQMIIWGGVLGTTVPLWPYGTGGRYHPASDTWTATSTNGAPSNRAFHTAVWTGDDMIVWGGGQLDGGPLVYVNTGGHYNPLTDEWTPLVTNGAPAGRHSHTALWTAHEMIVWGGLTGSTRLNTGARYIPGLANPWSPTSLVGAPEPRTRYSAVWDGSQMLVWGGECLGYYTNSGARYNPIKNQWSLITTNGAPTRRATHTAVWTGTQMIIANGEDNGTPLDSVHSYTPPRGAYLYLKP